MVNYVRGKVHYVKEEGGLIWFHIYSWHGRGWVSINKNIFDHSMRRGLIKELYRAENKRTERHIKTLERESKRLRKQGKNAEARGKEHRIHALRLKIKKDLHVHDLVGKRITLVID
jgi:hypothetical protein